MNSESLLNSRLKNNIRAGARFLATTRGLFFIFFTLVAGIWAHDHFGSRAPLVLAGNIGHKVSGGALVLSAAHSPFGMRYTSEVVIAGTQAKALIDTYDDRPLGIGDGFHFTGVLAEPEDFTNEYGATFPYKDYLRSKGISYLVKNARLENVQPEAAFGFSRALDSVKTFFESGLEHTLHEPAASLSEGVLIGDKGTMSSADLDTFRKAGLIHMVVLSGYNISVVAAFVFALFGFVGRRASLSLSAFAIVFFVLISGASATAVRAGVMGILAIVAKFFHREADGLRLLAITAIGMTIFSPLSTLYDPSFALSFLATFGLMAWGPFFSRLIENKARWIPERFGLREVAAATLGSQLMTFPYLALSTGAVSIVAFFANMLVLPLMPLFMLIAFITGAIGVVPGIGTFLSAPFSFAVHALSVYVFAVSGWFASLPFAMLATPFVSMIIVLPTYVGLYWYGMKLSEEYEK